jgi:redox-sensing transcriptional repressor
MISRFNEFPRQKQELPMQTLIRGFLFTRWLPAQDRILYIFISIKSTQLKPVGRKWKQAYTFRIMQHLIGVPLPTLRRLPLYYRIFKEKGADGAEWLSSESIGAILGFGAIQVRKDLGAIGATGSPKRGYPVARTIEVLDTFLGVHDYTDTFLVGSGILAQAVLADQEIAQHGFKIVGVFDLAPENRERALSGKMILPLDKLPDLARRMGVKLAILAVASGEAARVAEVLSQTEIEAVLDLSGTSVIFPATMLVLRSNFGSSLAALAGELKGRSS